MTIINFCSDQQQQQKLKIAGGKGWGDESIPVFPESERVSSSTLSFRSFSIVTSFFSVSVFLDIVIVGASSGLLARRSFIGDNSPGEGKQIISLTLSRSGGTI